MCVDCIELEPESRQRLLNSGLTAFASLDEVQGHYTHIYSLNTLEHIEDDVQALRDLHTKLNDGGKLFLYVPAFMCIFTRHDAFVGHFRRYTRHELADKLSKAGFTIERASYSDFLGFFVWWLADKFQRDDHYLHAGKIALYDKYIFPISRLCDRITQRWIGKNLLIIARKL